MIQGIFYAQFFPNAGTKIVAQSPPGCIVPSEGSTKPTLFNFDVLAEYIIPRNPFCNRYITVDDPEGKYTVLSYPVSISNSKYCRNTFYFNFGIVVESDVDQAPYENVVRRIAATFAEMEKQSGYLSQDLERDEKGNEKGEGDEKGNEKEERDEKGDKKREGDEKGNEKGKGESVGGGFKSTRRSIQSLLEIVKEDLNNYGECMIPVDDANTINMKLFPHHPTPPEVRGWHVPVAKMKFADIVDPTWDLTLQRVIQHIDGVNDVRRIAHLADVSLELCQLALRHLLYYDTILLLDMFFFSNCYAPRPGIHDFIANVGGMVDECANYVCIGPPEEDDIVVDDNHHSHSHRDHDSIKPGGERSTKAKPKPTGTPRRHRLPNHTLIKLMTTFCVGKTVLEWLKDHMDAGLDVLRFIDVRRFVQFGVIKGCLYRVHKYVVSKQYLAALATGQARPVEGGDPLQKYTDGLHCFDQIITEQNKTDAEIMEGLKNLKGLNGEKVPPGDLTVLYR